MSVESGGTTVVSLVRENDEVTISVGGGSWTLPHSGAVRIILHRPAVAISSAAGLFAPPITPTAPA